MDTRLKALEACLMRDGLDAALITSPNNRRYFSGFSGTSGILLITPRARVLFTDSRYMLQAEAEAPGFELVQVTQQSQLATVREFIKKLAVKRLGYEASSVSVTQYETFIDKLGAKPAAMGDWILRMRRVKSPEELQTIKAAAAIADSAFGETLNYIKEGVSELEIAARLEFEMRRRGAEALSFPTIIASGENGALPHAKPSERRLKRGDFVVMDFGCTVSGYCSDMTRTLAIGSVDDESARIYETVLDAQKTALGALRAGISGKALDAAAREHIKAAGYGEFFGHGTGHGVGLDIHEAPTASPISEDILESAMTITIEPGIYIPGKCGVRIEDLCIVHDAGYTNLVCASKEMIIL